MLRAKRACGYTLLGDRREAVLPCLAASPPVHVECQAPAWAGSARSRVIRASALIVGGRGIGAGSGHAPIVE